MVDRARLPLLRALARHEAQCRLGLTDQHLRIAAHRPACRAQTKAERQIAP